MNPNSTSPQAGDPSGPILAIAAVAATVIGGLYAGAQLAALAVHHHPLGHVTLRAVVHTAANLPKHLSAPRDAWPTGPWTPHLTGPVPFWACTIRCRRS